MNNPRAFQIRLVIAALFAITGWSTGASAEPWPAESRGAADSLAVALTGIEPSGAVWHEAMNRLFVAGDGGDLARLASDGSDSVIFTALGNDIEAVTYATPGGTNVFVGREDPPSIVAVDRDTGTLGATYTLRDMEVGDGGRRLEALTFIPDESASVITRFEGSLYNGGAGSRFGTGGLFVAGHQGNGRVYVYDVDTSGASVPTLVNVHGPFSEDGDSLVDLSGLDFHRTTGVLYAVWDEPFENVSGKDGGRVAAIDVSGSFSVLTAWEMSPGSTDEEGIAIAGDADCDGNMRIAIAEDNPDQPDVRVYEGFSPVSPSATTTTMPAASECGDAGEDGGVTATDALLALRTAVAVDCCRSCRCDVVGRDGVRATDALAILRASIGLPTSFDCPPC